MTATAFPIPYRTPAGTATAIGSGAGIEKAALFLLFAGTAVNWISSYLFAATYFDMPEWVVTRFYLYICAPAALLSLRSYPRFGGFAKSPALLATVFLMVGGLLWTAESELGRGALKITSFVITLPMASLVVKHDYKRQCIRAFAWGTVASLALAMVLEGTGGYYRFGTLIDNTGQTASNPNSVGAQAAFAASMLVLWFLQAPSEARAAGPRGRLARMLAAAGILFLVYCVFLSASRTAFIALAGTLFSAGALRCRRSPAALVWTALAVTLALVAMVAAASLDSDQGFYALMESRFQARDGTVGTLGSRTLIWQFAGNLLMSDYRWMLGFGTGGVDKALGAFFELGEFAVGRDGIRRLHSHSTFIDWALMFGLVGLLIPAWLTLRACWTGWRLDCEENGVERTSILMFALLFSFGGVITTEVFWIAFGTLLWAVLSPRRSPISFGNTWLTRL